MKVTRVIKQLAIIWNMLFYLTAMGAQSGDTLALTLVACYERAQTNYPLVKKRELIQRSKDYAIDNVAKGYLPQLSINGQATYQSAVTQIPIDVPGVEVPQLSKDQYKFYGELNQSIYDGGERREQKEMLRIKAALKEQQVQVDLYQLKERINQLFFGVLLLTEQLQQNALLLKDIDLGIGSAQGAVDHGTALKSSVDVLKAERLKVLQQSVDLKATHKAYLHMLGLFLNQELGTDTRLVKPDPQSFSSEINRPELDLFDYQLHRIDAQEAALYARNRPKFDFFFQGGYGRPALNILRPRFEAYYIGGVRLRWNLATLYTTKKEKALLNNERLEIETDKETFFFNTRYTMKQEEAMISRYRDLLQSDDEIVMLRERIKHTARGQLENGVIQTSDYLREVNAENQARLSKIIHEIEWLSAQYSNQYTRGN